MDNNHIKNAIDNTLSLLLIQNLNASTLLAEAKGEKKVKRKVSVALILSIALILVTIGTVAAVILSNKDFVQEIVVPIAKESRSDIWSEEEVGKLFQLAEQNGIIIPEALKSRLNDTEGRNKLEVMRSLVSSALGPYIALWSIEDQAWFDELMAENGMQKTQSRITPADGEISEAVALGIATKHLENEFNTFMTGEASVSYTLYKEYRQFTDENGSIQPRRWYFHFEPNDLSMDTFDVVVSSNGELVEVKRVEGVQNVSNVASAEGIIDYYNAKFGMHYDWTQKVWESFQADLQRNVDRYGHQISFTAYALKQKYGIPQASPMTEQDAVDAAYKATAQSSGIDEEGLRNQYKANSLLLVGKEGLVWKVSLVNTNPGGRRVFDLWSAEVNAGTGEVTNTVHYEPGKNSIYEAYYLLEVLTDLTDWPTKG